MTWPPTLAQFKSDMDIELSDVRDDVRLAEQLAAAVSFVQRVRPRFNYEGTPVSAYPDPTADLILGTKRLAARWYSRPRSPDGLIPMGDLGTSRVPSFDPDIDRLLRIGRHAFPAVG